MKIKHCPAGKYLAAAMNQHGGIHETVQDTLGQVREWMLSEDRESGLWVSGPEWADIALAVELHGAVHVVTGEDCDLFIAKGRTRGR